MTKWKERQHLLFNLGININFTWLASFPDSSVGKESTCNAGNLGSIPGLGRSPGEGKGYPLQDSGLENSMDYIVPGVTKSRTRLSDFHFTYSVGSLIVGHGWYKSNLSTAGMHEFLWLSTQSEDPLDGWLWFSVCKQWCPWRSCSSWHALKSAFLCSSIVSVTKVQFSPSSSVQWCETCIMYPNIK